MTNTTQFVKRQKKAFAECDITEAKRLLTELGIHLEKKRGWNWLRSNEPESYNELYSRLKDMSEVLLPAGKSTMRQFVRIYKWCEEHGIELEFLDLSPNLHKYREATAYLTRVISKNTCDDEIKRELLETVNRIKSDKNRDGTRSWTRKKRAGS